MKFKFIIQPYQTDAVSSIVSAFAGQPFQERLSYIRDTGVDNSPQKQLSMLQPAVEQLETADMPLGFHNAPLALSEAQLLKNIRSVQLQNNIRQSDHLLGSLGACGLDVEMETGTGKTYVYIKTMFELNRRYGWSKFIVVVPSIAIREGVKQSFEITQDHFMEHYGKKARFFIYSSRNLNELDNFSSSTGIHVMIVNMQAINARGEDARRIKQALDDFGSRRPIDVIAANRPILILDEPQKMGGEATQDSLKLFKSLFSLNFSATHRERHNLIYVLDALDAYNMRLVKKIEVKGFELNNLRGTNQYLFLESILISSSKPPQARIELEVMHASGIKREPHIFDQGDDLYVASHQMEQYRDGYVVSHIDPIAGTLTFTNGQVIARGEVMGDASEKDMRRIQIRETILSHFEKEEKNFEMGIKTLSLFFIDEVAKYRMYNQAGEEENGEYGCMFEEEYIGILNEYLTMLDTPYIRYLRSIEIKRTHTGYFSIDNKGRKVDSSRRRGSDESDDISAYDLILRAKEQLLSFEEPVRFIFSHSALREGWDNPNVFQICTLKHSDSTTQKRQEVGRGLRLCVDQTGDRMDLARCGDLIHDINLLTVIASESYKGFVGDLQKQIKEVLYERPTKASVDYFTGKSIRMGDASVTLDKTQAQMMFAYLLKSDYVEYDGTITDAYRADHVNGCLKPLPEPLKPMAEGIHKLVQSIFDEKVFQEMVEDGSRTKVRENALNDNFYKKEFQTLWMYINHKYAYSVSFDSNELIRKAVDNINRNMRVAPLQYTVTIGSQQQDMAFEDVENGESFEIDSTRTRILRQAEISKIKYDLIGKIAEGTTLTRRSVAAILSGILSHVFACFQQNPEEFILNAIRLIKEEKATMIVEHITYDVTDEDPYKSTIFTAQKNGDYAQAYRAKKAIQDYVFTDGTAEKSIERYFAEDADAANEVSVFAKLPKGFSIPTPVGNYSPDWAIAFHEGVVKHIYFIAETKGSLDTMDLHPIEKAKIDCARKLFRQLSDSNVHYEHVRTYHDLLNVVMRN